ncbi:MAG: helix-hairpin-helix domain-containing protein, partial [Casimicrobium sp.]
MPVSADDELFLRLTLTRGVGARTAHKLLAEMGDIEAVFAASESTLAKVVGDKLAASLKREPSQETRAQIE